MNKTPVARAPLTVLLARLPSVDRLLIHVRAQPWVDTYGRDEVVRAIRQGIAQAREKLKQQLGAFAAQPASTCTQALSVDALLDDIEHLLSERAKPKLRRVINLTGTVLHTNLGRAVMPPEVIEAMSHAAAEPCALEYDLGEGKRGDRDELVEELLCELTGAAAATVVNNNAAAVFLLLHALSNRRETLVSRGELIEIGGAFRIPDIMKRAGARLVEVGTTNRTHGPDFADAISQKTALLMKVHTSNYAVQGFTSAVPEPELASIAHARQLPFVVDLGSGTLVDLSQYGLPSEPTPRQSIANGADVVTFSCDKLLGGPQAGVLVGRRDLIQTIKKNPLKRVLRVGKVTLAGLEATLRLYRDPVTLPGKLTVLRLLTRTADEIQRQADALIPQVVTLLATVSLQLRCVPVQSQIGSGSLPVERLPSVALKIEGVGRAGEKKVVRLEHLLRACATPVIGRLQDKALILDLRCLTADKEPVFVSAIEQVVSRMTGA